MRSAKVLAWAVMKDGECLAVRRFKPSPMSEQEGVEFVPLVPQRNPLTPEEIKNIVREASAFAAIRRDGTTSTRIVRGVELAHGIQGEGND